MVSSDSATGVPASSAAPIADFSQQDVHRRKPIYDPPTPQYTYLDAPTDLEKSVAEKRKQTGNLLRQFGEHTDKWQAVAQGHLDHARAMLASVQDPAEQWLPSSLYMGAAFLATKALFRHRIFLLRWPLAFAAFAGTAYYTMPQTTTNVWTRKLQPLSERYINVEAMQSSILKGINNPK